MSFSRAPTWCVLIWASFCRENSEPQGKNEPSMWHAHTELGPIRISGDRATRRELPTKLPEAEKECRKRTALCRCSSGRGKPPRSCKQMSQTPCFGCKATGKTTEARAQQLTGVQRTHQWPLLGDLISLVLDLFVILVVRPDILDQDTLVA